MNSPTTHLHVVTTKVHGVNHVRPTIGTHRDAEGIAVPTLGDPVWHITISSPLWITIIIPGSDPGISPGDTVTLSITKQPEGQKD
jgi:hypothetical protein